MKRLRDFVQKIGLFSIVLFAGSNILPPRPEVPPIVAPSELALIRLRVSDYLVSTTMPWSRVQWLAGDGTWVTVDSWRSTLAIEEISAESPTTFHVDGEQVWAIDSDLYGRPNFRWQLLDDIDGAVITTTVPFTMPVNKHQSVTVTLQGP